MNCLTSAGLLTVFLACLAGTSEALWARRTWDSAKNTAKNTYNKVEQWGKDHPVALTVAGAVGGALLGAAISGKREAELADPQQLALRQALDAACPDFQLPAGAKFTDVVLGGFQQADKNGNSVLDASELLQFAQDTAIIEYCDSKKEL